MAGADYLLDTVIVAGFFNRDEAILTKLEQATVFVASITLGELYFGAYRSQRIAQNIANLEKFITATTILPCDVRTSQHYGQIKHQLKAKGRPIPENDIWIAAVALQHHLILATRDQHFNEVAELSVEIW